MTPLWLCLCGGLCVLGWAIYRWFVPTPRQRGMIALATYYEQRSRERWAAVGMWLCLCGARNRLRDLQCRNCGGPKP